VIVGEHEQAGRAPPPPPWARKFTLVGGRGAAGLARVHVAQPCAAIKGRQPLPLRRRRRL
jgi:hypothetical protein